jgi:hypothetical protein
MIIEPLKKWKWIGVVLGVWNFQEIPQDLLGFVT